MNKQAKSKVEAVDLSKYSRSELEQEYMKLYIKCAQAEAKAERFLEDFKLAQDKRFGKSSEKNIEGQMSLSDFNIFNEAEASKEMLNIEPDIESLTQENTGVKDKNKKKKGSKRKDISKLQTNVIEFKLSSDKMFCPTCGEPLHFVKETIRVEIEVEPPKVYVNKYKTSHYACRNCQENDTGTFVVAEGAPKELFHNSNASPSAVADCMNKKYGMAIPFDRIEKEYKRQGIPITKNNMCHWSIMAANRFFKPIFEIMREILLKEDAIHCDETFTRVIHQKDPSKIDCVEKDTKPYIWVTTTGEYQKEHPIALYNYQPGRSDQDAREVLGDYKGYVMCDGYACYESVLHRKRKTGASPLEIKPVGCLVHVKREFTKAIKLIKKEDRAGTDCAKAIAMISKIFDIDNKITYTTYEERKEKRLKELKPALEVLFAWLETEQPQVLPRSHYGQAIGYALNQKEKILRVLEDGRLELENNMAERTVKPFVIGRKNWMFSDTVNGAKASCIIYSIVETAKLNGLISYEYMKYVLEQCRGKNTLKPEEAKNLLPWSKTLPDELKNPAKA